MEKAILYVQNKDSDQIGWMPKFDLIVFVGWGGGGGW